MAEFGTLQLEFQYLSDITQNLIFKEKVDKVRQVLAKAEKPKGLYWNYMSPITGEFTAGKDFVVLFKILPHWVHECTILEHVSIGALGDSFYEYLLKASIMFQDEEARQMYDAAMDAFVANDLVRTSSKSSLMYIAEMKNGIVEDVVGHLACFAGGMFALGAHMNSKLSSDSRKERDMEIGKNFTNTCRESYIRSTTKIGPELFRFNEYLEATTDIDGEKGYILRPEVIESYFILYRLTGDSKYREWGWEAAKAIEKYSKAGPGRGYSGIRDVYSYSPEQDDVQQTFYLAETLKYLYLLFSTNDLISLEKWVFNTECHPLPIKANNPNY